MSFGQEFDALKKRPDRENHGLFLLPLCARINVVIVSRRAPPLS